MSTARTSVQPWRSRSPTRWPPIKPPPPQTTTFPFFDIDGMNHHLFVQYERDVKCVKDGCEGYAAERGCWEGTKDKGRTRRGCSAWAARLPSALRLRLEESSGRSLADSAHPTGWLSALALPERHGGRSLQILSRRLAD